MMELTIMVHYLKGNGMESPDLQNALYAFGIESLTEVLPKDINALFEHLYVFGDGEIRNIAKAYFLDEVDPNYEDNLVAIRAARVGDVELLEAFIARGLRKEIKEEVIGAAANFNQPECVDILIQKGGVNPRLLLDYCAYKDYPNIKKVVDQRIAGI